MPDPRPVAVFDSGMGSLSVVQELRRQLPKERIIYLADRARYPYGRKSKEQLLSIVVQTMKFLEKSDPKSMVVASITPSMLVLKEARLSVNVPVFGVYPSLDSAVGLSKTGHIAVMATEATIRSDELAEYLKPYIMSTKIVRVNASPIIDLVESGTFLDDKNVKEKIDKALNELKSDKKVDVALLGSTHLPLIQDKLTELFPNMQFVNPALDTVKQLKTYLQHHDMENDGGGGMKILVSKDKAQFEKIVRKLGIKEEIEEVSLDIKLEY